MELNPEISVILLGFRSSDNLRDGADPLHLGRFDPDTGQFSEWPSPSGPRSRPNGITHVGDVIWYAERGTKPNMLVRFDPQTEKFQSWRIDAGGGVSHIYADSDGSLWFTRPGANGIAQAIMNEE